MKKKPLISWPIIAAGGAIFLMMQMTAPAQTLLNRWSFNGSATTSGSGGTVTDPIGSQTATLEGDAYFDGDGDVVLDGTGGTYVSLPGGLISSLTAVSLEGWVVDSGVIDNVHLWEFSDGTGTGNEYARFVVAQNVGTANQFELAGFGGTTGDPNQQLLAVGDLTGAQMHVVCTYDPVAGVQAIYTNGILEAFRTFTSGQTTLSSVSANEGSLGQSPWFAYGDPYLEGTITEFRIWNAALNPLQVAALDAAGPNTVSTNYGTVSAVTLEVSYEMSEHQYQQAAVLATASGVSVQPNIASLCTYTSGSNSILTVSSSGSIYAVAPGSTTITATYGAISNTQTITVMEPVAVPEHRWSFNKAATTSGSGGTVTDSVGSQTATLEGDAYFDGNGDVVLDGTTGTYVALGSGLLNGISGVTCEAWVATNSTSPDNVHLFSFDDAGGHGGAYYRYNLHENNNGDNFSEINVSPVSKIEGTPGLGGLGLTHIVTIYDPTAQVHAIYVNGVKEVEQTGVTAPLSGVSTNEATLGQSPWHNYGDSYLNGSITEFRIFSGEMSPQQVAIDYLAGPGTLNTNGPGALQSIALQLSPTMNLDLSQTPALIVNYANLTNYNILANALFPVDGLTITSSAPNIISVTAVGTLQGDAAVNGSGQVTLDGTYGTYVSLPGALLSGVQILSVEAWLTNAVLPDNTHLFAFDDGTGTGGDYLRFVLKESSNGKDQLELSSGGDKVLAGTPGLGGLNVHVVCVYDPIDGVESIYTNGVLQASQPVSAPLSGASPNAAALGRSPWWNYGDPWLNASIDEFRIYSGRLLAEDVAATDAIGPNYLLTPPLSATVNSGSIVLSWPTNYASPSFTLYSSPVLGSGASWSAIGTAPSIVGGNFQITLPANGSSAKFFQLKR